MELLTRPQVEVQMAQIRDSYHMWFLSGCNKRIWLDLFQFVLLICESYKLLRSNKKHNAWLFKKIKRPTSKTSLEYLFKQTHFTRYFKSW